MRDYHLLPRNRLCRRYVEHPVVRKCGTPVRLIKTFSFSGRALVRHMVHVRYGISSLEAAAHIEHQIDKGLVDLVSIMDHTPGQALFKTLQSCIACNTKLRSNQVLREGIKPSPTNDPPDNAVVLNATPYKTGTLAFRPANPSPAGSLPDQALT